MAGVLGLGLTGGLRTAVLVVANSQIVQSESTSGVGIRRLPRLVHFSNGGEGGVPSLRSSSRCPRVVCMSVDVDDSPTEAEEPSIKPAEAEAEPEEVLNPRKGLEERFAVINLGKFECRSCGYVYDSVKGDSIYPVPAGIDFGGLPEDWRCPTCGAAKTFFTSKSVEIAGFAQNQQFGLGGNSLTEGQKSLLIYGTLAFFFSLFLAGYLLQ